MKAFDLEKRLIKHTISVVKYAEGLKGSYFENYLMEQLIRSAASPTLNYGEAQVAESRKDFIHKMKICLKELKETQCNFKLLSEYYESGTTEEGKLQKLEEENRELIAIFFKSIQTAKGNAN